MSAAHALRNEITMIRRGGRKMADQLSSRSNRLKTILIFVIIGIFCIVSAVCIQDHWQAKNRIRDNAVSPKRARERAGQPDTLDTEDGEITEGNLVPAGLIAQEEALSALASADDANYFEITPESADGYTGCAFESKPHDLARGQYTVSVEYESDSDGNYVVVWSPNEMDTNAVAGESGKVLARIDLPAGQTRAQTDLNLHENKFGVVIRIYYESGDLKIIRTETNETGLHTDQIWNAALIFGAIVFLYWLLCCHYRAEEYRSSRRTAAVLIAAIVVSCVPLMNDFLIDGHDLTVHLGRISGIAQGLQNGHFPVWINMVQGAEFGYAMPIMYPQLFLYIPALMMCTGMSLMNAYKIFVILLIIATIVIAYFSFRAIFRDRTAAVVGALTYSLCLYHLGDIYSRAALGEMQAMCFLPLLLWGFYEIYVGNERKWPIVAAGMTCILSCHMLSFVMSMAFIVLYFILLLPSMIRHHFFGRFLALIKAGLVTILLNLYFFIPFADYYVNGGLSVNTTNDSNITLNGTGAYLSQVFGIFYKADSTLRNKSYGVTRHEMMLSIGFVIPAAVIAFCWLYFVEKQHFTVQVKSAAKNVQTLTGADAEKAAAEQKMTVSDTKQPAAEQSDNSEERAGKQRFAYRFGAFMLVGTLLSLFMSLWLFPWIGVVSLPVLDKFRMVQYVWRFLMMVDLFGSALTGCVVVILASAHPALRRKAAAVILCAVFACTIYYLDSASDSINYYDRNLIHEQATDNLYLDENDPDVFLQNKGPLYVTSSAEQTKITDFERMETTVSFSYELPEGVQEADLTVPLYDYIGYVAEVNGKETQISQSDNFLVSVHVTEPSAAVKVFFRPKTIWKAGYVVSALTFILFIALAWLNARKKRISESDNIKSARL